LKGAVYHAIAKLAENELGNPEIAAEAYKQALAVGPRDLEAADALEAIYIRTADYSQLVLLLQRKMEMVEALPDKKELGSRAAKIWEEVLDDSDKAIEAYRQVLALDDSNETALDNLVRLFLRLSRWNDLKDVYAARPSWLPTLCEEGATLRAGPGVRPRVARRGPRHRDLHLDPGHGSG